MASPREFPHPTGDRQDDLEATSRHLDDPGRELVDDGPNSVYNPLDLVDQIVPPIQLALALGPGHIPRALHIGLRSVFPGFCF